MSNELDPEIASFFPDPSSSSAVILAAQHITAPMIQGQPITEDEMSMGGGVRVVYFIIDRSPSMGGVASMLLDGFNNAFVPAVKAGRADDISALRIGGTGFSSDTRSLWEKRDPNGKFTFFHTIDQLPPLTTRDYDPYNGSGTALHRAIKEGTAVATKYAAQIQAETGMDVDVDIIVLTDGANNERPLDPTEVRNMIQGRDKTRVRYLFFYFETAGGVANPTDYAVTELGIDPEQVQSFMAKPGETPEEQAKRFRRLMMVMSRVSAARNTSAVMATALTDDTELV